MALGFQSLPSVRSTIMGCLLLQFAVGGLLFWDDLVEAIRWRGGDTIRTAPTTPVSPGDQRRPYSPREVPSRPTDLTNPSPVRMPRDLPRNMTFSVEDGADGVPVLLALGAIDNAAAARFAGFLKDAEEVPEMLALHSPGGNVAEALKIGRAIREAGLNTTVLADASCLSSCPYLLAAGVAREVSRRAWVGMHQHYYDASSIQPVFMAVEGIQRGQGETLEYLGEMGIDPLIMVKSLTTPPEDIYLLVEQELLDFELATEMIE